MTWKCEDADPIDAVVTWVDGTDPRHQAKLNAYLGKLTLVPEIASADRYRESGEFAFCIASLLRFAPWLRRIWIVTDEQEPGFMPALRASPWREKVVVVDHRVLFAGFEQHLPTFNVRTLISTLWRIPELAERFVFLNDDFALLRPVSPTDFFREQQMVLRGEWCPQPWSRLADPLRQLWARARGRPALRETARPGNHQGQARAARMLGYRWRYFRVPHVPHPLRRSLFAEFFARKPALLEANLRHRLRSPEQFLADALVNHLALQSGRAVVDNRLRTLRLKPTHCAGPRLERLLAGAERDERVAFTCLQSLEALAPARRAAVFSWLERRIGRPEDLFAAGERPCGLA